MTERVVYKGKPSIFMFVIVAVPLGLVTAFCLRMAWVGVAVIGAYGMAAIFGAFAALLIAVIAQYGWSIFGPAMILEPHRITIPRAFRTHRYAISPDTQVIRWDRNHTVREAGTVGEAGLKFTYQTSRLVMKGPGDKPVTLSSVPYGTGAVEARVADLARVAGIEVQHLTPDGMVAELPPPPARWPGQT